MVDTHILLISNISGFGSLKDFLLVLDIRRTE